MSRILQDKKIATLTLGCKVNQYETDGMRELLEAAGSQLVDFDEHADVYIINTCSVTNMAERKSRQMLHRAKHKNPEAVVVAVGCYVQTVPQEVLDDLAVDLVVGNNCKKDIVHILEDYFGEAEHAVWVPLDKETEYEELRISHMQEHTRAYVKIQDGCNQFCSYCIIPYVRGRIRSRRAEDVLEEVQKLADRGCKEVVLTGIHLSSYGKDWDTDVLHSSKLDGTALLQLIQKISRIEGILRIRLGSLEPRIITEEFVQGIREIEELCPHFHLSLQSACNDTLRRMNRKYTIEEYRESCDRLRQAYDRPAITTDVIVGFPGETEEEFQTTLQNLEALNLYEIHVFKYSKRRGTVAEGMPGQVPEQEKSRRSDILLELTARQKQAYEESFLGEEVRVLVEEESKTAEEASNLKLRTYVGHTERYMKVQLQSEEDIVNQVIKKVWE
jgi:threonylcarbamoyladenosine tRNA methylthiotransferase MtaB